MKRRTFIKQTVAGSVYLGAGALTWQSCTTNPEDLHVTILHTNDVHSHIDPFPGDHAQYANMGGVARRAALIDQIRRSNPHTLLLDAGDIFQGTPYFNFYGGELEFKLMSKLGYDVATLGNHDFDNGIEGFYAQLPHAKFPFISANYDFTNTVLNGLIEPYKTFQKGQIKVGVFGLGIQLEGLVNSKHYKETKYLDPIEISADMTRILKEEEQCDLIICLSHLGYAYESEKVSDRVLASQSKDIDLIIGGHTHTFMEQPEVVHDLNDHPVLINQVGCHGIYLGKVDFYFEKGKKKSDSQVIDV